jgi:hypothetical protein
MALRGYDIDPAWRAQLFERYFSPEFRAKYEGVEQDYKQRIAARARADTQAMLQARAEVAAFEERNQPKPWQRALARCIASGRSESSCLSEGLVKDFRSMFGAILPGGKTPVTGLRLSGVYAVQRGLGVTFWDEHAVVACGQLVADERAYTVEIRNGQLVISVGTSPQVAELLEGPSRRFALTMTADGRVSGPGPTEIKGRVVVGHREWTRVYDDGRRVPMSEPIYEWRTARCNLGPMALTGPAPAIGTATGGLAAGVDVIFGAKPVSELLKPVPAGLRLRGMYGSEAALSLEFHPAGVVVGCGDAVVAREYTAGIAAGQVTIRVRHGATPFGMTLRPDGALAGSGQVAVSGRMLMGTDANGEFVWAPQTGTCGLGMLSLGGQTGSADAGPVAGAPTAAATPSTSFAPPASAGAAANAVLSVASGFSTPPGGVNPLGKRTFFLLRSSFEDVLRGAGLRAAAGSTAIKAMAAACTARTEECRRGAVAMGTNAAAALTLDSNGNGQFVAVPAGPYYLAGIGAYNEQLVIWNVRVELRAGQGSVAVDLRNASQ